MTRRKQIAVGLLVATLVLLAYVIYSSRRPIVVAVASKTAQGFVPLAVENPALRLDLLAALKKFQYQGPRRNIFSAAPMPVDTPPQKQPTPDPVVSGPTHLPGPPPLAVPATFFGLITDRHTGVTRAFFSEGDNVYAVSVGDVLLNRFRVVQIGNDSAQLQEIASGRLTTVTMERPAS